MKLLIWSRSARRKTSCCSICGPTKLLPISSSFAAAIIAPPARPTESVRLVVKEKYQKLPFSNEGRAENGWVVMDYGDVVVHFFAPDKRDYYGLEELWDAASKVMLRIQ